MVRDYGKIGIDAVYGMSLTKNDMFLTTYSLHGKVKKFNVKSFEIEKDFGKLFGTTVTQVLMRPDDESVFVYNYRCELKLFEPGTGKVIKDFEWLHHGMGSAHGRAPMAIVEGGRYLFSGSSFGDLMVYGVKGKDGLEVIGMAGWMEDEIRYMTD